MNAVYQSCLFTNYFFFSYKNVCLWKPYNFNYIFDEGDDYDDELFFVVWLTDERRLALFPAGTIIKDPHYHESLTCREQDLNLHRA